MPDYEIKRWDESNSKIDDIAFLAEAYKAKKWAFVTDYIRLFALYNEGGIYLDTDVIINKRFDNFLENDLFSAVEYHPAICEKENTVLFLNEDGTLKDETTGCPGIGILTAIIGAIPKHTFIKNCMDYYNDRHFVLSDGSFDTKVNPAIYSELAIKYGFLYKDTLQKLYCKGEGMAFYPSSVFAGEISQFTSASYALHCCENSWNKNLYQKMKFALTRNDMIRKLFHKKPHEIDSIIKKIIQINGGKKTTYTTETLCEIIF